MDWNILKNFNSVILALPDVIFYKFERKSLFLNLEFIKLRKYRDFFHYFFPVQGEHFIECKLSDSDQI